MDELIKMLIKRIVHLDKISQLHKFSDIRRQDSFEAKYEAGAFKSETGDIPL